MLLVARTDVNSRPESSGQGSGVEPHPDRFGGTKGCLERLGDGQFFLHPESMHFFPKEKDW